VSLFVTQRVKHVPKHRQPSPPSARVASRTAARTVLVLSSVAVAGTGVAVAAGSLAIAPGSGAATAASASVASVAGTPATPAPAPASTATTAPASPAAPPAPAASSPQAPESAEVSDLAAERSDVVSRSDRRGVADPVKAAALSLSGDNLMDRTEDSSDEDPRTIASALLADYGFSSDQMSCLDDLWTKESGWSVTADNPTSSAYGIPQALPGSKMSTAGADWATNPVTQIRWGLGYIEDRYGSPCGAWSHSVSNNWY